MVQGAENRVLARRRELGMHITVLAAKADRSAGLISMVCHGYCPKLSTMEAIAVALDTTVETLWPDEFSGE